eukprot:GHUV01050772.1.p1 GENE.GHUV01050772.1~~GHUV01050772.1.p1  ORF type:complete len:140 (+),score=0.02 GHUV01050772.1:133-552(+)
MRTLKGHFRQVPSGLPRCHSPSRASFIASRIWRGCLHGFICNPWLDRAMRGQLMQYQQQLGTILVVSSAVLVINRPLYLAPYVASTVPVARPRPASGHVQVEHYFESEGLPYTVFQPLYIYGPHTAKDCEWWFVDRSVR